MPLPLDFLQRIINVKWTGGAIFLIGTLGGLYQARPTTKDNGDQTFSITASNFPIVPFEGQGYVVRGSCYGLIGHDPVVPVFVVCGGVTKEEGGLFHVTAWICASKDGVNWNKVFQAPEGVTTDHVGNPQPWTSDSFALAKNPDADAFHFSMFMNKSTGYADQYFFEEQLFGSSDGRSWGGIGTRQPGDGSASVFPILYCTHNDCLDAQHKHVPDGVMHEDKDAGFLIRPRDPPTLVYGGGGPPYEPGTSNLIEIVTTDENGHKTTTTTAVPIPKVTCVAGNGDLWMVGGWIDPDDGYAGGIVVSSFDNGETWTDSQVLPTGVTTMIAAPISEA